MTMTLKAFRGIFRKSDGGLVCLDFYADNRPLALSHAAQLVGDSLTARELGGPVTLVRIMRLAADAVYDAGSFHPIT